MTEKIKGKRTASVWLAPENVPGFLKEGEVYSIKISGATGEKYANLIFVGKSEAAEIDGLVQLNFQYP